MVKMVSPVAVVALLVCACALGGDARSSRVTSGDDAEPGQFPYQVSLQWDGTLTRSHICGGAILTESWIITAAHCVISPPSLGHYVVVAGQVDFGANEGVEQQLLVKHIYPHPDYPTTETSDANDIALLKLDQPLVFNENVSAINLPAKGVVPTGAAVLSGWGVSGGLILPTHPDVLQYAAVNILSKAECRERYPFADIFDTNFCSRGRVATCSEDDGTPLVSTKADGTRELVGVAAYPTKPCNEGDQPSIYTQVSVFIDFIDGLINS